MQILITGLSGFIGQNLSKYLSNLSFSIIGISLRNLNWKESLQGNVIIHLAGKAHDTKKTSNDSEYFKVNTDLTISLFDAFLESEISDFIYFSSVKAVADEVTGILSEENEANPKTPYGKSKLNAENYILAKEIPPNKRVFIIRPCMIHGSGNKGNLNLLYSMVNKRIPYPLAAFDNRRSFLGIDNLNFMIKEILENKKIVSGVYNFADDDFLSTKELVKIISSVSQKKILFISVPKCIVNLTAKLGDLIKLPLNSEVVQKLTENYKVSNHKIKSAIGIEKLPLTAREGLIKTIKSFN